MDAGSSTLLPDRDKSLIPSHEHVDSDHGLYEYKHGLSSHIMVAGRLKTHIQFWKSTGTSPYILNLIKSGYRIPLYSMPPVSFSNNNTSASANAGFVADAISELLLTNHIFETDALPHSVNPLSVSVQSSGKKRIILDLQLIKKHLWKQS